MKKETLAGTAIEVHARPVFLSHLPKTARVRSLRIWREGFLFVGGSAQGHARESKNRSFGGGAGLQRGQADRASARVHEHLSAVARRELGAHRRRRRLRR